MAIEYKTTTSPKTKEQEKEPTIKLTIAHNPEQEYHTQNPKDPTHIPTQTTHLHQLPKEIIKEIKQLHQDFNHKNITTRIIKEIIKNYH